MKKIAVTIRASVTYVQVRAVASAAAYEEERAVNQLVTPELWPHFKQGEKLPADHSKLARKAYVVDTGRGGRFECNLVLCRL